VRNALFVVLMAAYPLAVYFGLQYFEVKTIGLVIASLFLVRWWVMRKKINAADRRGFYPIIFLGVGCGLIGSLLNDEAYIRLTPCLISATCFFTFSYTLWRPPSMIERFARIADPKLPDEAIAYTVKVTVAWCVFFVVNGFIALYTALFASIETWTLYNGLISYLLMGVLFAGEYCIRQLVIKKQILNE
jgi:uncharacterized membrane protein